jgi:hypothetical protein
MIVMNHLIRYRVFGLQIVMGAVLVGCLEPTQAILDITTDSPCLYGVETGISAGLLTTIETTEYDTTTSQCKNDGEIGSIVLVPPEDADRDAPFAFKVVASLGVPLDTCVAPDYGPNCIVARRAMRFVAQRPFHVPVFLSQACAGVACPETQTCVEGTCRSVTLDPKDCEDPANCIPDGIDAPPWQSLFAGAGLHMSRDVAVGPDGAVVLAGSFNTSVKTGDETFTSKGDIDTFIAAYAPTGYQKWARSFGGSRLDEITRVAVGPDGSIAALVWYYDDIDFGGGALSNKGKSDTAVVKFTAYGKLEWALQLSGPGDEVASSLAFDAQGNLFVVGAYDESFDIEGQTLKTNGGNDLYLVSLSRAGKLRWAQTIGGSVSDGATGITTDIYGNLYVTGFYSGNVDFDATTKLTSKGGSDAFVASYDNSGQFRWVKSMGSNSAEDRWMDVAARNDRVVVVGNVGAVGTLDNTPVGQPEEHGVVASFDHGGALQWVKPFAADSGTAFDVSIAKDGAVIVGGHTDKAAVFGSKPASPLGDSHAFVAVLNSDGTERWAQMFGSSRHAYTFAVSASPDNFVYAAGWFAKDFNNGVNVWTGPNDLDEEGFLLRIAPP